MEKSINKTEIILEELSKIKVIDLNSVEDLKAIKEINDSMEEIRREFQMKDKLSQISASSVILTT